MAHEACLLGTPSLYDGADHPGTTRELARYGLLTALRQPGQDALLDSVDAMLDATGREDVTLRRDAYLAGRSNLAGFIVGAIRRHAGA